MHALQLSGMFQRSKPAGSTRFSFSDFHWPPSPENIRVWVGQSDRQTRLEIESTINRWPATTALCLLGLWLHILEFHTIMKSCQDFYIKNIEHSEIRYTLKQTNIPVITSTDQDAIFVRHIYFHPTPHFLPDHLCKWAVWCLHGEGKSQTSRQLEVK